MRRSPDHPDAPIPVCASSGGMGKADHQNCQNHVTCTRLRGLASRQREDHRNLCYQFYWFAVQEVRLVLPLFHRVERRWGQHGVTADEPQAFDTAVLADDSLQHYLSLDA